MGSHSVIVQVATDKPLVNEVDVFSEEIKDSSALSPSKTASKGVMNDSRSHAVEIEWLDPSGQGDAEDADADDKSQVQFTSGSMKIASGIIHVFRRSAAIGTKSIDSIATVTALVLAVPSWMSTADFLNFVSSAHDSFTHLRVLRDGMPNRFMVLLRFRDVASAIAFYRDYNQRPFTSMEVRLPPPVPAH